MACITDEIDWLIVASTLRGALYDWKEGEEAFAEHRGSPCLRLTPARAHRYF